MSTRRKTTVHDPQLNMKNKSYNITYFRRIAEEDDTEAFTVNGDGQKRKKKVKENYVYFKENEVRKFSLDKHGESVPFRDINYTIIQNYLINFWQPILGQKETMLYITLLSYCYGEKRDYCFPSFETLEAMSNVSRTTLIKQMVKLEEYGFIYRFWTLREDGEKRSEDTPIVKVRKQTPLLSPEQLQLLPTRLIEMHTELFEKNEITLTPFETPEFDKIYDEFIYTKGESKKDIMQKELEWKYKEDYIEKQNQIDDYSLLIWNRVSDKLKQSMSKPAFDVYFLHTLAEVKEDSIILWVRDMETERSLGNHYESILIALFQEQEVVPTTIEYDYYTN